MESLWDTPREAYLEARGVRRTRNRVQRFLRDHPDASVADIMAHLDTLVEAAEATLEQAMNAIEQADCMHCGQVIRRQPGRMARGRPDDAWRHAVGLETRGCRAATWTEEHGYAEGLDPKWVATPR